MQRTGSFASLSATWLALVLGSGAALGAGTVDKSKIDAALSSLTGSKALVGVSAWSTRMDTRCTSARSARLIGRPASR